MENGGLTGPFKRGDLAPELEAVAFEIPVGDVSEIIETERAVHILMVETRQQDGHRPLDEVREELRRTIEEMRYDEALADFLARARDEADIWVSPNYHDQYGWSEVETSEN